MKSQREEEAGNGGKWGQDKDIQTGDGNIAERYYKVWRSVGREASFSGRCFKGQGSERRREKRRRSEGSERERVREREQKERTKMKPSQGLEEIDYNII
jgi:hypothetical protein